MSSFTDNVSIQPLPKQNMRITTAGFRYYVGEEGSNEYIDVPAGFVFDGASVPSIFGFIIQKVEPRTLSASALHDYLYTEGRRYSRGKTDLIFFESLLVTNCNIIQATLMRLAVVLFGRIVWYKIV